MSDASQVHVDVARLLWLWRRLAPEELLDMCNIYMSKKAVKKHIVLNIARPNSVLLRFATAWSVRLPTASGQSTKKPREWTVMMMLWRVLLY